MNIFMDVQEINGCQPKVIAGNDPSRINLFAARAKAMNWFERHGAARNTFKCEWGPPLRMYKVQGVPSPLEYAVGMGKWEVECARKGSGDYVEG